MSKRLKGIQLRGGSNFDSSDASSHMQDSSSESESYEVTDNEDHSEDVNDNEKLSKSMHAVDDLTVDLAGQELQCPKDVRVVLNRDDRRIDLLDQYGVRLRHTTGYPRPRHPLRGEAVVALGDSS
eukprot:746677-Hanusia_phi.AAC.4